jgi:hypothetical protein
MRAFLIALTRNPLSLTGAAVTTAAGVMIVTLVLLELFGHDGSPYIGVIAYLILPAIFVLGLVLIPVGIFGERRRARRAEAAGAPAGKFPIIDLNLDRTRHRLMAFIFFTATNVVILATVTVKGVEYMETPQFCGAVCHTVMEPEYTAYQRSPHARVACADCHIGPGADWFVKSKLSGAWQVVSVALDLYSRPIETPVHNLRPARDTCEQCHWPTQFVGDKLRVITHFAEDEENTELKTALVMRVGGVQGATSHGIHWHVDPGITIRYRSDPTRELIGDVEMTHEDGSVRLFKGEENEAIQDEWRVMDCVDCHNRPSHVFRTPEAEIDGSLAAGRISRSLPFIRREGVKLLREAKGTVDEVQASFEQTLQAFYTESYPDTDPAAIRDAAAELATIYGYNVFPAMGVDWETYPAHIGHTSSPGCFRCHDDMHETEDGDEISQDCFTCHSVLAIEEEDPEILAQLQP